MDRVSSKRLKIPKQVHESPLPSNKIKDAIQWSFSKANRFKPVRKQHTPEFSNLPSTLSDRSCSFGYGKRWSPINATGRDSPSPGTYESPSNFGVKNKGPSFKQKYRERIDIKALIPGPGAYNPYSPIGKRAPKYTFREKFEEKVRCNTPPPNTYSPSFRLVEKENYKVVSFGVGDRPQIYGKIEEIPGPGAYEIPSLFKGSNPVSTSRKSTPITSKRARTPIF